MCVGLILACRSFRQLAWCCIEWLLSYLVRWLPCIWITAVNKLICVIKVVQYFQTGMLGIESDWKVHYYSYSSILSYPSQSGGWLSVMRLVASGLASFSSHCPSSFSPLGSTRNGSVGILLYYSMSTLLYLGNSTNSGSLGVECLQPSLEVLGMLCQFLLH